MSEKSTTESKLSLPQVKKLLDDLGEANLDQLQRRTFDYVSKFAKTDIESAEMLVPKLVSEYGLEEVEAIQIVNCMPKSVEELRVFLAGGRKIIETSKLESIINILDEHRKLK